MKITTNFFKQIISFFALVRVQNILLLLIAFLLTAKYIFMPRDTWWQIVGDYRLMILLFSLLIAISSGYIINSFYDSKKDMINRPEKTILEQQLALRNRLYLYFLFNFTAVGLSLLISWRAAVFISVYIFLIWFYSHKIHAQTFVSNLMATLLSIFPFFAIFLFYKKFNTFIFGHAVFLFTVLLIKDLVKNFVNIKGDLIQQNKTVVIRYGEKKAKYLVLFLSMLLLIPVYWLMHHYLIGDMKYYFWVFVGIYYPFLGLFLLKNQAEYYSYFYLLIKILLVLGVLSIVGVKTTLS